MKKTLFLISLAGCLLVITAQKTLAQKTVLTTKTVSSNKSYTTLNAGEPIVIYKYYHAGHSAKEADKYAPTYFFTSPTSDTLKSLTKSNLKKTYPANHKFHDALDENFKEDNELINYDDFHKMYKVNRVFQASNQ